MSNNTTVEINVTIDEADALMVSALNTLCNIHIDARNGYDEFLRLRPLLFHAIYVGKRFKGIKRSIDAHIEKLENDYNKLDDEYNGR